MNNPRPRILAIDDRPMDLVPLGVALDHAYDLQIATRGETGLALASESPPDLIVIDPAMPDMDGHETYLRIRTSPRLRDIPVLFVVPKGDAEAELSALALGASGCIPKPIQGAVAEQRIRSVLDHQQARQKAAAKWDQLRVRLTADALELKAREEAVEAERSAHHAFLRELNHDIRTHLQSITLMSELALTGATEPRQAAYLDEIRQATAQLIKVTERLADHTEPGKLRSGSPG